MGGFGSGRDWHNTRLVAESCRSFSVRDLRAAIEHGAGYWGGLTWHMGERKTGSISYQIVARGADGLGLRLQYTVNPDTDRKKDFDYTVPLTRITLHGGGQRWYFVCMASRGDGQACGRRVAKLYLPPGQWYFACRHCYNLTYTSCNESHKYDGMYKRLAGAAPGMDWRAVRDAFSMLGGG